MPNVSLGSMDFQPTTSIDVIKSDPVVAKGDPEKALKAISVIAGACLGVMGLIGFTGACTTKAIPPILCRVLEPIEYSKQDTDETKEQVFIYNRVWNENCR